MTIAEQRRQTRDLVRLREVRMRAAAAALADARAATARAEAARVQADAASAKAEAHRRDELDGLATDANEAERRLALVDQAKFRGALALEELAAARSAERSCEEAQAARRKALIVARARHDVLVERDAALASRAERRIEERAAMDGEDLRRFR